MLFQDLVGPKVNHSIELDVLESGSTFNEGINQRLRFSTGISKSNNGFRTDDFGEIICMNYFHCGNSGLRKSASDLLPFYHPFDLILHDLLGILIHNPVQICNDSPVRLFGLSPVDHLYLNSEGIPDKYGF